MPMLGVGGRIAPVGRRSLRLMYVPRSNVMDAAEVRPFVSAAGSAELITVGDDGFLWPLDCRSFGPRIG